MSFLTEIAWLKVEPIFGDPTVAFRDPSTATVFRDAVSYTSSSISDIISMIESYKFLSSE